jgi:hypothetical protein
MGRVPQVDPDQLATLRLRAAFGPTEVLEVVDLALAVGFAAGLEGQDLQVAGEVRQFGQ